MNNYRENGPITPPENMPFSDVFAIYRPLFEANETRQKRGGIPTEQTPITFRPTNEESFFEKMSIQEGPHFLRQSTFSAEQRKINNITLGLLIDIINENPKSPGSDYKGLNQQIQKHFVEEKDYSFLTAITSGIKDAFSEFAKRYPSFLSSLLAMLSVGGNQGIELAIEKSSSLLERVITEKLVDTEESIRTNIQEVLGKVYPTFVGVHFDDADPSQLIVNYEILCPGITLSYAIARQSAIAALALKRYPQQLQKYPALEIDNYETRFLNKNRLVLWNYLEKVTLKEAKKYSIEFTPHLFRL